MISLSFALCTQHIWDIIGTKCIGSSTNHISLDVYNAWNKKYSHHKFSEKNFVFWSHYICSMIGYIVYKNTQFLQKLEQWINSGHSL